MSNDPMQTLTDLYTLLVKGKEIDEFLAVLPKILETFQELKRNNEIGLEELRNDINSDLQELQSFIEERVKAIKVAPGKDGRDGKDGLDGADGRDGADGKDGKDGKDADAKAIEQAVLNELKPLLNEELRKVRSSIPRQAIGGGVSNLRIQQAFKYILKTEAPVGDIDGVNTTYTVSQPIFAVLAFSLNGETIAQLPNYTISGNTVTFSSALPAAYSGKDFEMKYI